MTTVPYQQDPAKTRRSPLSGRRLQLRHGEGDKRHLTSLQGLSALSLDALSSVAYGPEAAALVLAGAGAAAVALTLPITIAIAVLLLILVFSYRQVIAAHPDGGGSYGVAKAELGRRAGLLAAAALVVDYVLTIAVSLAAAAANLASAFPVLRPYLVETCLAGVLLLTVINLFGVSDSARFLMLPMSLFVVSVLGVVAVGLARSGPAATVGTTEQIVATEALTVMLILRAFSSGCSSLTGIEAIANGVPMFRKPRVKRAQHTELMLGALLATMLIGLAVLIRRDHVVPREGVTILAQLVAELVRDRLGVLRHQHRGRPRPGPGRQHQLRRPAGAAESAGQGQAAALAVRAAHRTARLPVRRRGGGPAGRHPADRGGRRPPSGSSPCSPSASSSVSP
ncbi:amino acid permease [Nonomuraea ferruginea]